MTEREERFETMLRTLQQQYRDTVGRMEQLKAQGKEKSATYRQLLGNKLLYQNMLDLYRIHGLIE